MYHGDKSSWVTHKEIRERGICSMFDDQQASNWCPPRHSAYCCGLKTPAQCGNRKQAQAAVPAHCRQQHHDASQTLQRHVSQLQPLLLP
jgi:hypothetical protein